MGQSWLADLGLQAAIDLGLVLTNILVNADLSRISYQDKHDTNEA